LSVVWSSVLTRRYKAARFGFMARLLRRAEGWHPAMQEATGFCMCLPLR
jgi:hypothetical protein